jgi:hypothetical protein
MIPAIPGIETEPIGPTRNRPTIRPVGHCKKSVIAGFAFSHNAEQSAAVETRKAAKTPVVQTLFASRRARSPTRSGHFINRSQELSSLKPNRYVRNSREFAQTAGIRRSTLPVFSKKRDLA